MYPRHRGAIQISGGFWLLLLWFAQANGFSLLATVVSAAALHELGHYLVLRACGIRVRGLRLNVFGAEMKIESGGVSYGRELAAVLAGPIANLLCALMLLTMGRDTLAGAHLVLCAFNLLPVRPLDGGRALELAVAWAAGPAAGEWISSFVGSCTALILASMLMWLMWRSGGSLWLLPAVCGFWIAAARNMRMGKGIFVK
jgi:stage IV sporulation protein FB